jgi:hypothetical protein
VSLSENFFFLAVGNAEGDAPRMGIVAERPGVDGGGRMNISTDSRRSSMTE